MARPKTTTLQFRGPFQGVNKAVHPLLLSPQQAQSEQNWVLDRGTLEKRPGWVSDGSHAADILGMYDYRKVNSGVSGGIEYFWLIKEGQDLYAHEEDGTETRIINGTMSSTDLASFVTVNNRVYVCDGTVFQVTDGATAYTAAITRPSSAPTVATGSAGNPYGDYDYKYTFYSSTWGQESAASDASQVVGPRDQQVALTSLQDSADARVDKKRIYRRKVSASESEWKLVAEIADDSTTTHNDNSLDNDVSSTIIAPLSYSSSLPNFRMMAYQLGVLFLADGTDGKVYYSKADQPWSVTDYLEVGSTADGERVTGLWAYHGVLVVFKENSIWTVSGNSPDTFFVQKVISGTGCKSHHSIVDLDIYLAFLGEDGFYAFDGREAQRLSGSLPDPISPDLRARNFLYDKRCVGIHFPDHRAILWSYTNAGQTENQYIYAYFYEASRRNQFPCWSRWNLADVTYLARLTKFSDKSLQTYLGFDDGHYGRLTGHDDDGSNIISVWESAVTSAGAVDRYKIWQELVIEFERPPESYVMYVQYSIDNGSTWVNVGTTGQLNLGAGWQVLRKSINASSRTLAIRLQQSGTTSAEILGWSVEAVLAGRVL